MKTYSEIRERLRQNAYYLIVFVISIIATTFLPMVGSTVDIAQQLPTNAWEWVTFIFIRCTTGALNVSIFASFIAQARVNISDNENYKKANDIMNKIKKKREVKPRSPKRFIGSQWAWKGTTLLLASISATFVLTSIILTFDYMQLIVYLFVISLGVVFGYMTMRRNEVYRTTEYLEYAEMIQQEELEEKNV